VHAAPVPREPRRPHDRRPAAGREGGGHGRPRVPRPGAGRRARRRGSTVPASARGSTRSSSPTTCCWATAGERSCTCRS
jgi:hypothetical protein